MTYSFDRIGLARYRSPNLGLVRLMKRTSGDPDGLIIPNIHQYSVLRNVRKRFTGHNLVSHVEKNIPSAYENNFNF